MSSSFAECELTISSLSDKKYMSCETSFDFFAIEERHGECAVKFKAADKFYEFNKVQFKLCGFKNYDNQLNEKLLKLIRFISTSFFNNILWNCFLCKVGRASIWRSKRGEVGVLLLEINYPIEIRLSEDVESSIKAGKKFVLNLSGNFHFAPDLSDDYTTSLKFIFNSCRWSTNI